MDACTVILLAKTTTLEKVTETYKISTTESVAREVLKGKEKMFKDALLFERLEKERKISRKRDNKKITKKLEKDFNMGKGEASTIAAAKKEKKIIATDNKQGRKAAEVYNVQKVGSTEIITSLYKREVIDKQKAKQALEILREEGWFEKNLIEKAMEEIK